MSHWRSFRAPAGRRSQGVSTDRKSKEPGHLLPEGPHLPGWEVLTSSRRKFRRQNAFKLRNNIITVAVMWNREGKSGKDKRPPEGDAQAGTGRRGGQGTDSLTQSSQKFNNSVQYSRYSVPREVLVWTPLSPTGKEDRRGGKEGAGRQGRRKMKNIERHWKLTSIPISEGAVGF